MSNLNLKQNIKNCIYLVSLKSTAHFNCQGQGQFNIIHCMQEGSSPKPKHTVSEFGK